MERLGGRSADGSQSHPALSAAGHKSKRDLDHRTDHHRIRSDHRVELCAIGRRSVCRQQRPRLCAGQPRQHQSPGGWRRAAGGGLRLQQSRHRQPVQPDDALQERCRNEHPARHESGTGDRLGRDGRWGAERRQLQRRRAAQQFRRRERGLPSAVPALRHHHERLQAARLDGQPPSGGLPPGNPRQSVPSRPPAPATTMPSASMPSSIPWW